MKKIKVSYILGIISIICLIKAPLGYSHSFCLLVLSLSVFFSLPFILKMSKKEGLLNFHTIFLVGFICINYLHLCFVYPEDLLFSTLRNYPYYDKQLNYCISVAFLGQAFYMIGAERALGIYSWMPHLRMSPKTNKAKDKIEIAQNMKTNRFLIRRLRKLNHTSIRNGYLLFFIGFLMLLYVIRNQTGTHLYPRLMMLIVAAFVSALLCKYSYGCKDKTIIGFIKNNKFLLIGVLLFILSQLIIGSRAEVIMIALPFIGFINRYVYKFRFHQMLLASIIVMFVFTVIMLTRITDINFRTSDVSEVFSFAMETMTTIGDTILIMLTDLIVNSRNLYDGIGYSSSHGYLYGLSYLPYIFSFIPFLPSFIMPILTGMTVEDVNTAFILSKINNASFGLGTNIIGDLYMNFGLIGVPIVMYFFGQIVQKTRQSNNKYMQLLYFVLLGNSLYLGRASIVAFIDMYVFCLLLYWIMRKV